MSEHTQHERVMRWAIELSAKTSLVDNAGGVFGTVIVKDGEIIAEGANRVVGENGSHLAWRNGSDTQSM